MSVPVALSDGVQNIALQGKLLHLITFPVVATFSVKLAIEDGLGQDYLSQVRGEEGSKT